MVINGHGELIMVSGCGILDGNYGAKLMVKCAFAGSQRCLTVVSGSLQLNPDQRMV